MNNKFKKELSIIIPTRNEADSIALLVERINVAMLSCGFDYEIIVIDDHSIDKTKQICAALSAIYPLTFRLKKGRKGKAFSLIEGFYNAKFENIAYIDADLQYPPEALPKMALLLTNSDIIVANRKKYKDSFLRKFLSRSFRHVFGKKIFGLDHDIQSGLKVFKKSIFDEVKIFPKSAWTFDLEFLYRASLAGFKIADFEISFEKRQSGASNVGAVKTSLEIGQKALLLKLKKIDPIPFVSNELKTMRGAGLRHRKRKYITHTTLHHSSSSITTFTRSQKTLIFLSVALFIAGIFINPMLTLSFVVASMSAVYFADTIFNLFLVINSLKHKQEIEIPSTHINNLDEKELPIYTILCPLYKEAHVIPQFLRSIKRLDWPKEKLDVMLLLEEDDVESIEKVKKMILPPYVRTIVVPNSQPKTKPKACNYGLSFAKGEYLVIFDAEDKPESLQLKKAYIAFQSAPKNVICLQAKLNYYNPYQNLLTRFFTAEYSLWFDVSLTGLQSINTSIPLGGTSNHFRTSDLHKLEGWDPFNVTEDADLGMRLFKRGYKTAIIDSITLEEANSKWGNWIRQRSRWIKGYMQTYLVHTRQSLKFAREHGKHFPIFHLIIGGKIAFILINPFLWLATIAYFTLYSYVGPSIEKLYPSIVFYMAVTSLVFGNFLFMYYYMIGAMKRHEYGVIKYVFLIPIYWIAISIAGFMALYQLLFKPHYWEKTVHGLHLLKKKEDKHDYHIPKLILKPVRYAISLIF